MSLVSSLLLSPTVQVLSLPSASLCVLLFLSAPATSHCPYTFLCPALHFSETLKSGFQSL